MVTSRWAVIEAGQVTNIVLWDGDPQTWTPPANADLVPYDPAVHVLNIADVSSTQTLHDRLAAGVAANRALIAAAKPGTAAVQASVAYDGMIRLAKMVNALTMLVVLDDLSDQSGT